MNTRQKTAILASFFLAIGGFIMFTATQQQLRNARLALLADDEWCIQKIHEVLPGYPYIEMLGNVTNTEEMLHHFPPRFPNLAKIVIVIMNRNATHLAQPEYYRWFIANQREPDPHQWDPTNHFYQGFITSDLELYHDYLDAMYQ